MRKLCALMTVVALTGCGGGSSASTARNDVSVYIAQVNGIQQQMRQPLVGLATAIGAFTHATDTRTAAPALQRSERSLRAMHARLAKLTPPKQAQKLHRLLLQLVEREVEATHEVRQLATFTPSLVASLRPLTAANAKATARLSATRKRAAVLAALADYRVSIEAAIVRLRALDPPLVLAPMRAGQEHRLVALDQALAGLAGAIKAGRNDRLAAAQRAVAVASVSSDTRARQLAQRAAVVAYDARIRAIYALAARAQAERNRLQVQLH